MMKIFKSILTQIEALIYILKNNEVDIETSMELIKDLVEKKLDSQKIEKLNEPSFAEDIIESVQGSVVKFSERTELIYDSMVKAIYKQMNYLDIEMNLDNDYVKRNNARLNRVNMEARIVLYRQLLLGNDLKSLYEGYRYDLNDFFALNAELINMYSDNNQKKVESLRKIQSKKAEYILEKYEALEVEKVNFYNIYEEDFSIDSGLKIA